MKLKSCILIALIFFFTGSLSAQKGGDDEVDCLIVTGKFDETMKGLQGKYAVKLLLDNRVVEEQNLKVSKGFKFTLKKNKEYTLKIEKEGYIHRMLSVSTKLSEKANLEDLFKFYFETNLIEESLYHHFDDDDIDFPIALVAYAKKCDCFEYNKKYTQEIMSRMMSQIMTGY